MSRNQWIKTRYYYHWVVGVLKNGKLTFRVFFYQIKQLEIFYSLKLCSPGLGQQIVVRTSWIQCIYFNETSYKKASWLKHAAFSEIMLSTWNTIEFGTQTALLHLGMNSLSISKRQRKKHQHSFKQVHWCDFSASNLSFFLSRGCFNNWSQVCKRLKIHISNGVW